ncbi:HAD domain-containing protein [Comamonas jiangduensis]|uniref:HAD domain-containing protein n=1 Tax=Comamonas jiangduensis TaxID=1194168 RepID=UPI0028A78241|nr:HAD domain-containing protein [Comamonas jiangduensis]
MSAEVQRYPLDSKFKAMPKPHQKRILFLDFDGVLHPPRAIAGAKPPQTPAQIRAGWPQTFEHLPVLVRLLAAYENVGVVVSSSWRQFLKEAELAELLESIRPWFAGAIRHGARDEAIREYVSEHAIEDFAVLDDVAKFFPGSWPQLILCNPALGISDLAVQRSLKDWLFQD